ncbi:hypothetical protein EV650_3012 [Kribbella kalugense]|uniref:Uncharacterized protein n=1 Tax=Kribbella kalugense TaxID=2512221 RepID=A0A4R8A1S0_9ACTN|nr:hypothetical protein EV650_3012 [Kribbella kalugense]
MQWTDLKYGDRVHASCHEPSKSSGATPEPPAGANHLLTAARMRTVSRSAPGRPMSRSELAQRVAELLYAVSTKRYPITGHYIAKLERGAVWWPCEEYRAALCLILGARDDSELGFRSRRGCRPAPPPEPLD